MSGGTVPAPFLQEFPFPQYAIWLLNKFTSLSVSQAGQMVAESVALLSAVVWPLYAWRLPVALGTRLLIGGLIFFLPGFLRYGATAVPDGPRPAAFQRHFRE